MPITRSIALRSRADAAAALLAAQSGLAVSVHGQRLLLHYRAQDYTLARIEALLLQAGFELADDLAARMRRALAHYLDDIAHENLATPAQTQKADRVFRLLWSRHPHGDHDDTPQELRHYL